MNLLEDFMKCVNYRITEGSEYCWKCFGNHAYRLDSWNGEQEGHTVGILFDTKTQETYQLEVCDYQRNRAYRWTNPNFKGAHDEEARATCPDHIDQAWDDVNYIDLETTEDFFDKASKIVQGVDYDTRVSVPINMPDDVIFEMMKKAHEMDITFNQLVEQALQAAIDQHERGEAPFSRYESI
jgi:hypothetical protein